MILKLELKFINEVIIHSRPLEARHHLWWGTKGGDGWANRKQVNNTLRYEESSKQGDHLARKSQCTSTQ
jgi:hypothetical protein